MINTGNEEVQQLLQSIQSVALDMNKFFAMDLVELQHISSLEFAKW